MSDFREIFEKADIGIALNDPDEGTVGMVNQRYADMMGYTPEDLKNMPIGEITADDPEFTQEDAVRVMEAAMDGEVQEFKWPLKHRDGEKIWCRVSLQRAIIGGKERLLAFVTDITEQRQQRHELSEKKVELEKYTEIYNKADDAIGLIDPETGEIVDVNPRYCKLLGYSYEELVGKKVSGISADTEEFSQEKALNVIMEVMEGEHRTCDWLLKKKDCSTLWVEASLKRVSISGNDRLLVFLRDISERQERKQQLEEYMHQMEFFNSLLRHDVLNGMTVIRTRANQLLESVEKGDKDHAEVVVEWADNVSEVINRIQDVLKTLTGEGEKNLKSVSLSEKLIEQTNNLDNTYPEITVETDVPSGLEVRANDLLGDVFKNVLKNIVDHNDTEGLHVSTTVKVNSDGTALVRIADNGQGIADEYKDTVFERGERGHVKKSGSGFGLYFVGSMIEAYGGDVWAEDNEPSGTVVVMEMPVVYS